MVERSERYASVAKPEEPRDSKRRAWAVLVSCWFLAHLHFPFRAERPTGEARNLNAKLQMIFSELLTFLI